jgi:hypothetical protein
MNKKSIVLPVFATLVLSSYAFADTEGPIAYKGSPLGRLVVQDSDDGSNSKNVVLGQVLFADLPEYIQLQATDIATCAGKKEYIQTEKYFSYVSDYNRSKRLPANYIIDTSAFKDINFKNCDLGEVCKDGECALLGFKADSAGWARGFWSMMYSWSAVNSPKAFKQAPQTTWIDILSMRDASCVTPNGIETDDGCTRRYEWRRDGLAQVSVE